MTVTANTLRKAVDHARKEAAPVIKVEDNVKSQVVVRESRELYKGFIKTINSSSDNEIARALAR